MNTTKILWKTLTEMSENFSSVEFGKQAYKNGFDDTIRNNIKKRRVFLLKNTNQLSTKMWQRKGYRKMQEAKDRLESPSLFALEHVKNGSDAVEEAIALLKSKGYKIMKEVIEFKEV